jgi:hypothetical protein
MLRLLLSILGAGLVCYSATREQVRPGKRQVRVPVWLQAGETSASPDFQVSVDGRAAKVLSVATPKDDMVLLLVMDLSGDSGDFEIARRALAEALDKLSPNTYVGLLRAQDGLSVLEDPTPDRAAVKSALDAVTVTGQAGLFDTVENVERIADAIAAASPVRIAVLYVSDSDVRNYREDLSNPVVNSSDSHDLSRKFPDVLIREKVSKLEASLLRRQTPLFLVHLRSRSDRLNEAYENGLRRLVEITAGSSVFCRSGAEIPEVISRLIDYICSQYTLTVELPVPARPSVQIQVNTKGSGGGIAYRARIDTRTK